MRSKSRIGLSIVVAIGMIFSVTLALANGHGTSRIVSEEYLPINVGTFEPEPSTGSWDSISVGLYDPGPDVGSWDSIAVGIFDEPIPTTGSWD